MQPSTVDQERQHYYRNRSMVYEHVQRRIECQSSVGLLLQVRRRRNKVRGPQRAVRGHAEVVLVVLRANAEAHVRERQPEIARVLAVVHEPVRGDPCAARLGERRVARL